MNRSTDALLASWRETLASQAKKPAIYDTRRAVLRSFSDIADEAREFSRREFASVPSGEVVALQTGNHPAWPALLLACLERGLVVVPLERSISDAERAAALATCHVAALVTSAGIKAPVEMKPIPAAHIGWDGAPPSLLKLTSGTTAPPRAIRFRSHQLLADCAQICDTMEITERDLNFAVIPVSHSYGFSNLITPLIARGVPLALSNDRLPRAVLDDLARTEATVFPGMPLFYQAFSAMEAPPELPELRLCISAGAPLPLPVAQQFREKYGRAIHSFYGSSECGGICYDREARLTEEGFVGAAMNNVELEWRAPGLTTSQIRVRSAAAGDGYFPEPDASRLGAGKFVPDDLLAARAGGLAIVGRVSDVINVAGKKVNPAEVEATLLQFTGVREAAVFGLGSAARNETVAACIVAESDISERALLEFCRARLSGWQVPKRIFVVAEMPVNERGKISRRALAEKFGSSPGDCEKKTVELARPSE